MTSEGNLYITDWWCNFEIKRPKVKVTANENVKIVFHAYISSSKVDRFTSNQDQNDPQPILQIVQHLVLVKFTVPVLLLSFVLERDDDEADEDVDHKESDDDDVDEVEDGDDWAMVVHRAVVAGVRVHALVHQSIQNTLSE